jgi:hypothetical protein
MNMATQQDLSPSEHLMVQSPIVTGPLYYYMSGTLFSWYQYGYYLIGGIIGLFTLWSGAYTIQ